MELIGAGFGRTGTLTLKTALEILGLPCYHMIDVVERKDMRHWLDAAEGKPVDLQALLSGYKATCDWPTNFFYKDLMTLYPDAKVILTVRDPAKWYASTKETVWDISKVLNGATWYVRLLSGLLPPGPKMMPMVNKVIWEGLLKGTFEDPEAAQQRFVEWIEEVKQYVPPERLLVFEPKQGWEPLCAFLGKPVPDQPFPHVNDTQAFKDMVAYARRTTTVLTYGVPAVAVALLGCVAMSIKRRS